MRTPLLLIATISLFSSVCQATTFTDKPMTYASKNSNGETITITFPFLESDQQAVADRINLYLHDAEMRILPPARVAEQQGALPVVMFPNGRPIESMASGGIRMMNGARMLQVLVESEGCGAYCSEAVETFNFDTANGRALVEPEIVSSKGRLALAALANKAHAATLKREIAQLEKLKGKRSKERSADEVAMQIEMYTSCLANFEKSGGYGGMYDQNVKSPGYMTIIEGALSFSQGECSSHAVRALDDLGALVYTVKGDKLRPYLTTYGKYLMLGEGDGAMPPVNPYGQFFHGKINKNISVTLFLGSAVGSDQAFEVARYYYDKFRKPIELTVKHSGNSFELTEVDSKDQPKPVISLRLIGARLQGNWHGGGKTLSFDASP